MDSPARLAAVPAGRVEVEWQVAHDEHFRRVVRTGRTWAEPRLNPHVRYFDGSRRGYLRRVVNRSAWHADVRTVETIDVREAPVTTSASYAVEAGGSRIAAA